MRSPSSGMFHYIGGAPLPPRTVDGFSTGGDLGWLEPEGYLHIVDRRVDMIITGGANVFPAEVETALIDHPEIADVVVVGLQDAEWGRRVHAIIEADRSRPSAHRGRRARVRQGPPRRVQGAEVGRVRRRHPAHRGHQGQPRRARSTPAAAEPRSFPGAIRLSGAHHLEHDAADLGEEELDGATVVPRRDLEVGARDARARRHRSWARSRWRVPMAMPHIFGSSAWKIWNCRLSVEPVMKPPNDVDVPRNSPTVSIEKFPSAARCRRAHLAPAACRRGSPRGHPSGMSTTSRRNRSTAAGSGVTILTWFMPVHRQWFV